MFYALQPRQLNVLARRHLQGVEEREFLFAQLTSAVVNFSYRGPKEMVHPKDFMPSQMHKEAAKLASVPKRLNRKKIDAKIRGVFGSFFGDS